MSNQSNLNNPPAVTKSPGAIAKQTAKKLINILLDDHNYDIVSEIITHIKELKRAKKIKPLDKHRMVMNYNITLLSYCVPKMKIIEDSSANTGGKGVVFHIQIGGTDGPADPRNAGHGQVLKDKKKGVSINIPTQKNKDGTYTVSGD